MLKPECWITWNRLSFHTDNLVASLCVMKNVKKNAFEIRNVAFKMYRKMLRISIVKKQINRWYVYNKECNSCIYEKNRMLPMLFHFPLFENFIMLTIYLRRSIWKEEIKNHFLLCRGWIIVREEMGHSQIETNCVLCYFVINTSML